MLGERTFGFNLFRFTVWWAELPVTSTKYFSKKLIWVWGTWLSCSRKISWPRIVLEPPSLYLTPCWLLAPCWDQMGAGRRRHKSFKCPLDNSKTTLLSSSWGCSGAPGCRRGSVFPGTVQLVVPKWPAASILPDWGMGRHLCDWPVPSCSHLLL